MTIKIVISHVFKTSRPQSLYSSTSRNGKKDTKPVTNDTAHPIRTPTLWNIDLVSNPVSADVSYPLHIPTSRNIDIDAYPATTHAADLICNPMSLNREIVTNPVTTDTAYPLYNRGILTTPVTADNAYPLYSPSSWNTNMGTNAVETGISYYPNNFLDSDRPETDYSCGCKSKCIVCLWRLCCCFR